VVSVEDESVKPKTEARAFEQWSWSCRDISKIAAIYFFTFSFRPFIMPEHLRATYNDIHNLIKNASPQILEEFKPEILIAIGT